MFGSSDLTAFITVLPVLSLSFLPPLPTAQGLERGSAFENKGDYVNWNLEQKLLRKIRTYLGKTWSSQEWCSTYD